MNSKKGFTLIELLVVIAIIGILSSVVLASLTTARSKGTAAAIQAEVANMRAQAELYYSTTGSNSYATAGTGATALNCTTNVFTGTNSLSSLISDATAKGATVTCVASTTAWAVNAAYGGTNYCADSTGKSSATTTTVTLSTANGLCI